MAEEDGAEALTRTDYENLAAFRHALRRFSGFSADAARQAGLTAQQHQALLAIKGHAGGPPTIGGLAEQLLVAPHSAAELVARLGAAGLVTKVEDTTDRRRVGLHLTPRAEAALGALTMAHLREVRILAPRLARILREIESEVPISRDNG